MLSVEHSIPATDGATPLLQGSPQTSLSPQLWAKEQTISSLFSIVHTLQQEMGLVKQALGLHSVKDTSPHLEEIVIDTDRALSTSEKSQSPERNELLHDSKDKKSEKLHEKEELKNKQLEKKMQSKRRSKICFSTIKIIAKTVIGIATTVLTVYCISKTK